MIMNLNSLYMRFASHPEGSWIMIYENVKQLYNFILNNPIKKVLDLGCGIGCSASIIALALKDKGETDYHIDSIEQFDKCIKLANEIIPEELKKNITIHKSEVEIWQTDMIPYEYFSNYKTIPGWDYDFILNDGPAPFREKQNLIELPNGTIHKALIENNLKPKTIIACDGRIISLKLLERYFGYNFYLISPAQGPGGDFNVLERKDTPFKFEDMKLKSMEGSTYFGEKH